jgi:hypothetical protein
LNRRTRIRIHFAINALVSSTALEIACMLVVGAFSSEIFAAISLVVGTILGSIFGQKA